VVLSEVTFIALISVLCHYELVNFFVILGMAKKQVNAYSWLAVWTLTTLILFTVTYMANRGNWSQFFPPRHLLFAITQELEVINGPRSNSD
jgi:hypothetical protein